MILLFNAKGEALTNQWDKEDMDNILKTIRCYYDPGKQDVSVLLQVVWGKYGKHALEAKGYTFADILPLLAERFSSAYVGKGLPVSFAIAMVKDMAVTLPKKYSEGGEADIFSEIDELLSHLE